MSDPVLFCYRFAQEGGAVPSKMPDVITEEDRLWVHLDSNHTDARHWLKKHLQLDEHLLDALLHDETRPRVIRDGNAALMLFRGVNLNTGSDPEDMVTLRIYADKYNIITLRGRKLMAATDVEAELQQSRKTITSGHVLCRLIDRLLGRMAPVLETLDDTLDFAEEKVIEYADTDLRSEINTIRKQAIMFRRYIAPQRDAIYQIRGHDFHWLDENHHEHLLESHNHVQRYVEDLDAIRERAQIVKDELANILSDRMNRNTFILTVVAAIFLPISFLTGLLGVNLGGIPGAEHQAAFWIFVGLLSIVLILQIIWFKKMKWF